jgi:hypothetical protein
LNPRPIRTAGLALTVVGLGGAALAYASAFGAGGAPAWAGAVLGVASILIMTGAAVLAAARAGGGVLAGALLLGGTALAFAMASVWTIPPVDPAAPRLYLGLPRAAAHLLLGIGVAPAILVPLLYAWTFDRATLSEEDLERVRRARRPARGEGDR